MVTLWQHRGEYHHATLTENITPGHPAATQFIRQLSHTGLSHMQSLGVIDRLLTREALTLAVNDDYPRSLAAYRLADVLVVNPIRDGMNLVAKEGPLLSERGCALVLSREAGAAAELGEAALLVNPYDVSGTAQALHEALDMPAAERQRRCGMLAKAGSAVSPHDWFADQLSALDEAARRAHGPANPAGR